MLITTIVVGLIQIAPNICRVDILNPDMSIDVFNTKCEILFEESILKI